MKIGVVYIRKFNKSFKNDTDYNTLKSVSIRLNLMR